VLTMRKIRSISTRLESNWSGLSFRAFFSSHLLTHSVGISLWTRSLDPDRRRIYDAGLDHSLL
jgi:hypothetical protein